MTHYLGHINRLVASQAETAPGFLAPRTYT
jgi:hypothetical protein